MTLMQVFPGLCLFTMLTADADAGVPRALPGRMWTFEGVAVETKSGDEQLLQLSMQIVRIKRNEFALSGFIDWKYDVGNDTYMEFSAYRSATGSGDYKLLPLGMPRIAFYNYVNTIYKDVVLKNFGDCSNLPQFEGKFQPPWPQNNYTFDRCQPKGEALPQILLEGYYKVFVKCYGKVDWSIMFLLRVKTMIV